MVEGMTRGHQLLESWLITRYGVSERAQGRPRFRGIEQFHAEVQKLEPVHMVQSPSGVYAWLPPVRSTTPRKRPKNRAVRNAVEQVTEGFVPAISWFQEVG